MGADQPSSAVDDAPSNEETVTIEFASTPPSERTNVIAAKRKVCETAEVVLSFPYGILAKAFPSHAGHPNSNTE
jgi:hypothetical protein